MILLPQRANLFASSVSRSVSILLLPQNILIFVCNDKQKNHGLDRWVFSDLWLLVSDRLAPLFYPADLAIFEAVFF